MRGRAWCCTQYIDLGDFCQNLTIKVLLASSFPIHSFYFEISLFWTIKMNALRRIKSKIKAEMLSIFVVSLEICYRAYGSI
tara:strand:+ start:155 stop:397 length:243 start_codon:yes stop_codon:yes gene_type:complete